MTSEPIVLRLRGAGGEPVDLWRTINSHGFSDLPPLVTEPATRSLGLTLRLARGAPRRIRVRAGRRGTALVEVLGPGSLGPSAREAIATGAAHVLRLDQDLSRFYAAAALDPDLSWVVSGAGRMLRGPTVWEDVVKTLCTTNCSWSLTLTMVRALVENLGEPAAGMPPSHETNAFPTPEVMAGQDERFYREVVRSGYRAPHLARLAQMTSSGELDLEGLAVGREELPDDEVERRLLALPGIGPYAAAHIMMTLGRNSRLILDSWTRPKYARLTGRRVVADRTIERRFRRYGPEAGLAFWLFLTRDWVD
jgi:3-methyladenine DNA glycosylase/8-oxoguanine DNA glycosylase